MQKMRQSRAGGLRPLRPARECAARCSRLTKFRVFVSGTIKTKRFMADYDQFPRAHARAPSAYSWPQLFARNTKVSNRPTKKGKMSQDVLDACVTKPWTWKLFSDSNDNKHHSNKNFDQKPKPRYPAQL